MDFFAREEFAHRTSRRLAWLFIIAVVGTVVTINILTYFALNAYLAGPAALGAGAAHYRQAHAGWADVPVGDAALTMRLEVHLLATVGTLAIIAFGSLWKISQLSGGGAAVASMMGGREVSRAPQDAHERMLVNVVEEMSIASGVPMPAVYLLAGESGINAFAAGHHSDDAVVAVTRGCIERLSRDELQGVIGHEFSHLLNGDMRINLRLMGLVHGLLVIGFAGALLMRISANSSSSSRRGGNALPLLLIGLGIYVVGYIGYFFGGLIKAAISRQREFLADASSVQFTRNPAGLAGALKKLGSGYQDAAVANANSHEASHFFFGDAVSGSWFALLQTHPPLEERIRAIDPQWDGRFADPSLRPLAAAPQPSASSAPGPRPAPPRGRFDAHALIARAGTVSPEHVIFGAALLASLPSDIASAAQEPYSARALALCLMLDADLQRAAPAIADLASRDQQLAQVAQRLHPAVCRLGAGSHLPILDLCLPALRQLSGSQRALYLDEVRRCARQAGASLGAYCMATLILNRLGERGTPTERPRSGQILAITPLWPQLHVLLSALARAGAANPAQAQDSADQERCRTAFAAAAQRLLGDREVPEPLPAAACGPDQIDAALTAIDRAAPEVKRRIITACAWCVASDGVVTIAEAELLRVISSCLGCPMPPFAGTAQSDAG